MRIGINIPNELMKRLEPLKPELNISQVCREALAAKAGKYEQMKTSLGNDEVNSAVAGLWEREKEFPAAIDFDWEMLGYEDAAAWVKSASWDNWDDLLEELHFCKERNWPECDIVPPHIDGVKWVIDRETELHNRTEQLRQRDHGLYRRLLKWSVRIDYKAINREYMTAWISHVKAVWELVRERELQYLDEQTAKRSNPPQPEVPEHILQDIQRGR